MGLAVAAGDFDGDGRDDLAFGAPSELDWGGDHFPDGAVFTIQGSPSLRTEITSWTPWSVIDPADLGITGGDREVCPIGSGLDCTTLRSAAFGYATTTGDFDCDGREDLAIGAPAAVADGSLVAGAVGVVYGGAAGLGVGRTQTFTRSSLGIGERSRETDGFGQELAAGNFDGDVFQGRPCVDLAVASADLDSNAGGVYVLSGSPSGLAAAPAVTLEGSEQAPAVRALHLGQGGLPSPAPSTAGALFGSSLAITRADGDRYDDLVIGSPGDDDAKGKLYVLRGSALGLTAVDHVTLTRGAAAVGAGGGYFGGDWFGVTVSATAAGVVQGAALADVVPLDGSEAVAGAGLVRVVEVIDTAALSFGRTYAFTEESGSNDASGQWTLRESGHHGVAMLEPRPAFVRGRQRPARFSLETWPTSGGVLLPRTAPDCAGATATPNTLWPPTFGFVGVQVGVAHPAGIGVTVEITGVRQDERRGLLPDARLRGGGAVALRAERRFFLDGRVYHVAYRATAASGVSCEGEVLVCVPVHSGGTCVDGGARWSSTP
ncbi:MAG: FG-GAP repeat protein [Polyangiaceae bacterium]|nr:FG-GAP repeat protein [Polyangiaceae bacterium]